MRPQSSCSAVVILLAFELSAPNIVHELPVRDTSVIESIPPLFSDEGYIQSLVEAVEAFVASEAFELGVELLSMMFTLHKSTGQFRKLVTVGRQLADLAEKASTAVRGCVSPTWAHVRRWRGTRASSVTITASGSMVHALARCTKRRFVYFWLPCSLSPLRVLVHLSRELVCAASGLPEPHGAAVLGRSQC